MLKDYLDRDIYNSIIKAFSFNDITEIRMRVNEKIIIVVKNKKYYLKDDKDNFYKATPSILDSFILKASEYSIYAFNESISSGYITLPKGIRVGLTGKIVTNEDKIITIKEYQSINIRIPHFIKNCSLPAYDYIVNDDINNSLIISPPGCGKTTFIRDLVYQLYIHNVSKNVLIADERNEIASVINGMPQLPVGGFCDIYTNCSKKFAFTSGIRSMSPDVIITDEIDIEQDMGCITQAINSGVNVVATIHAKDINQLNNKPGFEDIINKKYFARYIVLSNSEGPGTLVKIYDDKLNCIYCR